MSAPTLPGIALRHRTVRSRCLFHWRASDRTLTPITGQVPTFSRASSGRAIDALGRGFGIGHSGPRFEMVDLDGDGIRETAGLLLEQASGNVCSQPENLSTWGQGGTPVLTSGQPDPFGGSAAYLVADDSGTVDENINIGLGESGDGTKAVSLHLRQGTSPVNLIGLFDSNAATWRHMIRVTWTNGVPVLTTEVGSGLRFPVGGMIGGWWWCAFNAPGVVAANLNQLVVRPTNTVVSEQASLYVFGVQVEEEYFPTSYMGPALSRAAEQLSYGIDFGPQELTAYVRFIERGARFALRDARILNLGDGGNRQFVVNGGSDGSYNCTWTGAAGTIVGSSIPSSHAYGDLVELAAMLKSDGRVQIFKSVNGGAVVAGAESGPNTDGLSSTFNAPTLFLHGIPAGARSAVLYRDVKVLPGVRTMQDCRETL